VQSDYPHHPPKKQIKEGTLSTGIPGKRHKKKRRDNPVPQGWVRGLFREREWFKREEEGNASISLPDRVISLYEN